VGAVVQFGLILLGSGLVKHTREEILLLIGRKMSAAHADALNVVLLLHVIRILLLLHELVLLQGLVLEVVGKRA
jgi:hypothetical protein